MRTVISSPILQLSLSDTDCSISCVLLCLDINKAAFPVPAIEPLHDADNEVTENLPIVPSPSHNSRNVIKHDQQV